MSQNPKTSPKPLDPGKPSDQQPASAKSDAGGPISQPMDNRQTPRQPASGSNSEAASASASPMPARRSADGTEGGKISPQGSSSQGARPVAQKRPAVARTHVPANDDMPSIGGLIYALQQRPSRSPFLIALFASAVWFVLGLLVSWAVFQKSVNTSGTTLDMLSNPAIIAVIATIIIPIALFWFLAILVWRAQELRLMSSAMTEVAVRLAEPDRMAEQSVASLGQTVRRQVAAMNDAISRALGRAGELEALVHNEVAALERSYSENENRIRNLISELASEREALANNSDRVSEALRGVGTQVTREITAASEKASMSLATASEAMAENFANRGQKITAAVNAAGIAIDDKLAERGARITEQLAKHGAQAAESLRLSGLEVTRSIQETSDRTAAAISAKGNSLVTSVIGMSERVGREIPALLEKLGSEQTRLSGILDGATRNLTALESALAAQTQALGNTLQDRTNVLQTVLTDHSKKMDVTLTQRINDLETILGRKTQVFDTTMAQRTKALETTLSDRAQAIEVSVGKQTASIRDTIERHSGIMDQTLSRQAQQIERVVATNAAAIQRTVEELAQRQSTGAEALSTQARALKDVSSTLMAQLGGLTKRFEDQGTAIMSAARTFETSNAKIDTVLEQRQAGLSRLMEGITSKASDLDRMMNSYSQMLEQSLSQAELRARKVTEVLAKDSAEKSQTAIRDIERLRQEAQTHTAKAVSELQANFSSLSDQVASQLTNLSSKFSDTTRNVRDSTRRAAGDLEAAQTEFQRQAKGLPETAKQNAAAMRRALQDQLSALDALSDISKRHSYSTAVSTPVQRAEPQRERDPYFGQPPHDAALPTQRGYDYEGGTPPASPAGRGSIQPDPSFRNFSDDQASAPSPSPQPTYAEPAERRSQWSLGDLLARASEDDQEMSAAKDDGYGTPPVAAPPPAARTGPRTAADNAMDFNMSDIAAAIDERRVMDVWQRLKRGDMDVLQQRGLYPRSGEAVVERVRRRFETDETFRFIVERYCTDFEKGLHDLSRSDPRGGGVQTSLASDNGRIYFVLAHISGRLSS